MKKVCKLLSFLESEVASLNRKNKLGLAENYRYSGNSFRHYLQTLHRHDVPLSRVSAELLIAYQQWLLDRGIQRNTSAFYLRNLQAVYNKAVSQGLVADRKPFADVCTTITHTEKRAVSTPLILAISTLDIAAGLVRLGHDPRKKPFLRMLRELTFSRDTFIFCFCARGLTFVDFAYLRCENIRHGSLIYARRKTGQCLQVAIQSQMQAFLDRYALSSGPYLYRRRYYSEPINDEERMEVVMRYVHQEPLRVHGAGLMVHDVAQDEVLDEWEWSSWHEYVGVGSDLPIVCEKPDACHNLTTEQWRKLLSKPLPEGTKCLEPKEYRAPKPTDTQVLSMVKVMTIATTWEEFKAIPREEQLKTIKQLLQNGASIRQMEKLTGIGRGVIQNL